MNETWEFPTLLESMSMAEDMLRQYCSKCSKAGFDALWGRWAEKQAALGAHFNPDGRLVKNIGDQLPPILDTKGFRQTANVAMRELANSLRLKHRFCLLQMDNGHHECIGAWLEQFLFKSKYTMQEIASNRSVDGPLSKMIAQIITERCPSGRSNNLESDEWDPHGHLTCQPYEHRALVAEFAQILYSRIVEVLAGVVGGDSKPWSMALSINPLDLLIHGMHTTGWGSCHRLNGDAPLAPLSYICDLNTAVAFAYTRVERKQYSEYLLEYPIKAWRQLVHFDLDNHSALCGRQYPSVQPDFAFWGRQLSGPILAANAGTPCKWNVIGLHKPLRHAENEVWDHSHNTTDWCEYSNCSRFVHPDPPTEVMYLPGLGEEPSITRGASTIPCLHCGSGRRNSPYFLCAGCLQGGAR